MRAWLRRLLDEATAAGCRRKVALSGDSANAAWIGLHVAFGFRHAGTLEAVGLKFGRWLDVVMMRLALGEGAKTVPGSTSGEST